MRGIRGREGWADTTIELMHMDITPESRRGPEPLTPETLASWARRQLGLASEIVDNPGGGLLFATQTIGQVKAALRELDEARWLPVVTILDQAEDHAIKREFGEARERLAQAAVRLDS